jgi:hypothetical protein
MYHFKNDHLKGVQITLDLSLAAHGVFLFPLSIRSTIKSPSLLPPIPSFSGIRKVRKFYFIESQYEMLKLTQHLMHTRFRVLQKRELDPQKRAVVVVVVVQVGAVKIYIYSGPPNRPTTLLQMITLIKTLTGL